MRLLFDLRAVDAHVWQQQLYAGTVGILLVVCVCCCTHFMYVVMMTMMMQIH